MLKFKVLEEDDKDKFEKEVNNFLTKLRGKKVLRVTADIKETKIGLTNISPFYCCFITWVENPYD